MKASYTVRPGLTIEVAAETQGELFAELSSAAEVFGERSCGRCGCVEIVPVMRTRTKGSKTFHFAEWRCTDPDCGATLSLGVRTDDQRLFPKRRLDAQGRPDLDKGVLDDQHSGWTRYRGPGTEENDDEAPSRRAGDTPPEGSPRPALANGTAKAGTTVTTTEPPKPATPPTPGRCITSEQWQTIQDTLKTRFISPRAFLERYGYGSPRDIMASHYDEALAAATAPDEELRAAQKRVKVGTR